MKGLLMFTGLCLAGSNAWAQETAVRSGDEEAKAALLKKVDDFLKTEHSRILAEVKKMLDDHFAGRTAPAAKARPFLGVQYREVPGGIEVAKVEGDGSLLKVGDIVTAVGGKKVSTEKELQTVLGDLCAGKKASTVQIQFRRGGQDQEIKIRVATRRPDQDGDDEDGDDDDAEGDDDDMKSSNAKPRGFLGIQPKAVTGGLELQQVIAGMPAEKAGLKKGDILVSVAGRKVASVNELISVLRELGPGKMVELEVLRGGSATKVSASLAAAPQDDDDDDEEGDDDDKDGDDDDDRR